MVTGTTSDKGRFRLCLPPQKASNDVFSVKVAIKSSTQVLDNVVFGDVWIASGQSNMAFATKQAFNASAECAAASIPGLRLFTVASRQSNVSLEDFDSTGIRQQWSVSSPDAVCGGGDFDYFSAVAFFFGRELHAALGTPVGLIATTVPGTNIELWSPPEALTQCPNNTHALNNPSFLFNGMVAPLTSTSVRGFIWYQGEANVGQPNYGCRFKALIRAWRAAFDTTAPTPLSPYHGTGSESCPISGGSSNGALPAQRLLQTEALTLPSVGMASAVDLGDSSSPYWPGSVHPRMKQPVGLRLALEALRIGYNRSLYMRYARARGMVKLRKTEAEADGETEGEEELVSRGPQLLEVRQIPDYTSLGVPGSYHGKNTTLLRLRFDSVGSGLVVPAGAHAAVAFVATMNDSSQIGATIMPNNQTVSTIDIYINNGFFKPHDPKAKVVHRLAGLPFDFPWVPLFNRQGLPMEPFNITLSPSSAAAGDLLRWRRRGSGSGSS
eukprot:g171.t1